MFQKGSWVKLSMPMDILRKVKENGGVGRYLTTKVKTRAVRMGVRVGGGKEFQLFVGLGEGWGR